ncbi:MAG: hypothetical protein ACE5GD_02225 [Candidatus Geothermarchaeales archaeon]
MLVDKYSREIMRKIATSTSVRFKDLMDVVGNPRTLSRKLKALVAMGLVDAEAGNLQAFQQGRGGR